MTSVLVTGGAGFIGSQLADRLLAEGHRVVSVDDLTSGRIANLVEARGYGKEFSFFNMDVRADGLASLFERHRPEVVFHLAAQSGVRPSLDDPVKDGLHRLRAAPLQHAPRQPPRPAGQPAARGPGARSVHRLVDAGQLGQERR